MVLETIIIPLYEEPKMISSWNALATTFHLPQSNPQPEYLFKEDVGFEPTRRFTDLTVFKTVPLNLTWVIFQILEYEG